MSEKNTDQKISEIKHSQATKSKILSYGSVQSSLFAGATRVDRKLRTQAERKTPKSRNRRPTEVIYEWTTGDEAAGFQLRFYTTIDTKSLVTRAERTGRANVRISVRDCLSKKPVNHISAKIEIQREVETDWQNQIRQALERAFLFCWQKRPQCFKCRTEMEVRVGRSGEFWGCRNYPECRTTLGFADVRQNNQLGKKQNQPEKGLSVEISKSSEKPDAETRNMENRKKETFKELVESEIGQSADAKEIKTKKTSENEVDFDGETVLPAEIILDVEPLLLIEGQPAGNEGDAAETGEDILSLPLSPNDMNNGNPLGVRSGA